MAPTNSLALKLALVTLMIDSILELSFVTATVGWLHNTASGTFAVRFGSSTFELRGEPANLLTDQGHTSNGAAGTAFVLVGLGGIIALWLRGGRYRASRLGVFMYYLWVAINLLAVLLTLAALAYVFSVTRAHDGQDIDVSLASTLHGRKYPLDTWTPQNWFAAVLRLDVANGGVLRDIRSHYRIMLGWQYNLIPMFVIQLGTTVLAVVDCLRWRKETRYGCVVQAVEVKG